MNIYGSIYLIYNLIVAYLACHWVGDFQAPPADTAASPPCQGHAACTDRRGHDLGSSRTACDQGRAGPPRRLEGVPWPAARGKTSLGSLKQASVEVGVPAPGSSPGRRTWHVQPHAARASAGPRWAGPPPPRDRPRDPGCVSRCQQLLSEWKQKSLGGRGLEEGAEGGPAPQTPPVYIRVQAEPGRGPQVKKKKQL